MHSGLSVAPRLAFRELYVMLSCLQMQGIFLFYCSLIWALHLILSHMTYLLYSSQQFASLGFEVLVIILSHRFFFSSFRKHFTMFDKHKSSFVPITHGVSQSFAFGIVKSTCLLLPYYSPLLHCYANDMPLPSLLTRIKYIKH